MFYVQMYNIHKHNIMYILVNITRLMFKIQTHTYLYYTFYLTVQHSMVIP